MEETHIALTVKDYVMIYGAIFTSVTTLVAVVGSYFDLKAKMGLFTFRMELVDASIEDLKRTASSDKLQDERILQLQRDNSILRTEIHELQRGRGYVSREINGLYSRTGKVEDIG